jgi:toluene monooxygenase system protein E
VSTRSGLPVSETITGQWREDSTLLSTDWNAFRDPSGMYYRNYVVGQDAVEKQLDAVYALASDADFISALDPAWREALTVLVGTMSFAQWGMSMAMQHVMRFTLSPTVACAVQLQIMDKLRAAERSVEWYELLNPESQPETLFSAWDEVTCIQPLHRYIEEVLVEVDWGEVIVATNLVLAGLLEPFLREVYIKGGRAQGDFTTAALGTHLAKDATRQVAWTDAFLAQCSADEANAKIISTWVDRYLPIAAVAIDALAEAYPLEGIGPRAAAVARTECRARLDKVNVTLTDHVAAALAVEGDVS